MRWTRPGAPLCGWPSTPPSSSAGATRGWGTGRRAGPPIGQHFASTDRRRKESTGMWSQNGLGQQCICIRNVNVPQRAKQEEVRRAKQVLVLEALDLEEGVGVETARGHPHWSKEIGSHAGAHLRKANVQVQPDGMAEFPGGHVVDGTYASTVVGTDVGGHAVLLPQVVRQ